MIELESHIEHRHSEHVYFLTKPLSEAPQPKTHSLLRIMAAGTNIAFSGIKGESKGESDKDLTPALNLFIAL